MKEYQVVTQYRVTSGTSPASTDIRGTSSRIAELLNHHAQQGWEPKHIFEWVGFVWIILERDRG
jgi:hypothetical protein